MARPQLIRDINQSRALLLLKEHQTLSRAAFARALNLTRATVTGVASEQKILQEYQKTKRLVLAGKRGRLNWATVSAESAPCPKDLEKQCRD
jgi:hypothetical protein